MAKQTFKVEGLSDLKASLDQMSKATSKNVQKRALLKALAPMEAMAEALAPVLTGELRRGISEGTKLTSRQMAQHNADIGAKTVVTSEGFRSTPKTTQFVFMGPQGSSKSIVQEFGSVHQSPHPYMRPAWDANKEKVLKSIGDDLAEEIEKAAARAARKAAKSAAK